MILKKHILIFYFLCIIPISPLIHAELPASSNQSIVQKLRDHIAKTHAKLTKEEKNKTIDRIIGLAIKAGIYGFLFWLFWRNRYEIIATFLGGAVFLNQNITIGNAQCKGRQVQLANNVVFKQFISQDQVGGSCGYWAAYNGLTAMSALNGNGNLAQLLDANNAQALFGPQGQWRQQIIQRFRINASRGYTSGEWLGDGEIEEVMGVFGGGIQNHQYIVINNPDLIGRSGFDEVTPLINQQIRPALQNNNQPYAHLFIVGNMQHSNTEQTGSAGHWRTLLLNKRADGSREYLAADSAGNWPIWRGNDSLKKIIGLIEGQEVANRFDT